MAMFGRSCCFKFCKSLLRKSFGWKLQIETKFLALASKSFCKNKYWLLCIYLLYHSFSLWVGLKGLCKHKWLLLWHLHYWSTTYMLLSMKLLWLEHFISSYMFQWLSIFFLLWTQKVFNHERIVHALDNTIS